jgi:hypothetical protein
LKNERVKDQGTINMSGAIAKSQMNQQTMNVKAANKRQEATDKSTRKTERASIIATSSNGMNFPNGFLVRVGSFCFSLVDDYIELVLNSPSRLIIIYGRTWWIQGWTTKDSSSLSTKDLEWTKGWITKGRIPNQGTNNQGTNNQGMHNQGTNNQGTNNQGQQQSFNQGFGNQENGTNHGMNNQGQQQSFNQGFGNQENGTNQLMHQAPNQAPQQGSFDQVSTQAPQQGSQDVANPSIQDGSTSEDVDVANMLAKLGGQ